MRNPNPDPGANDRQTTAFEDTTTTATTSSITETTTETQTMETTMVESSPSPTTRAPGVDICKDGRFDATMMHANKLKAFRGNYLKLKLTLITYGLNWYVV